MTKLPFYQFLFFFFSRKKSVGSERALLLFCCSSSTTKMFSAIKFQATWNLNHHHHHHHHHQNSAAPPRSLGVNCSHLKNSAIETRSSISLPPLDLRFSSLSLKSDGASSSAVAAAPVFTSSIGSSPASKVPIVQLNLNNGHILFLNIIACATAISTCWLFFSAIPALLAFKRAAESLEKLLDVTREELPDTMAAMRLSGMEISDLTMELSDLGQEITQGVRRSTRVVRVAEDRIRSLTTMSPTAMMQKQANPDTEKKGPAIATAARGLREGIVKGRSALQLLLSVTRFAKVGLNYFAARKQKS